MRGKSILTDSLVAAAGNIPQETAPNVRMTDTQADERKRGFSIKSTDISLCYKFTDEYLKNFEGEHDGNEYIIYLIDSPGHVDFSAEVTAALCITDGALVVIDCIEGVCLLTETVLRLALGERIRPVLILNKIDRCFLNLKLTMMNADKCNFDESEMMKMLWGDNFYDTETREWTQKNTGAATCKRGFVQFCYVPIKQIINNCMMNTKKKYLHSRLKDLGATITKDKGLTGKPLMQHIMQTWLPAATALHEMMIFRLPSPHSAQRYRVETLYGGPSDAYANAIKECDPNGPLILYVSKMIPDASDKGRFFAFGRVFAGKISTGMKVRIMGPNYKHGEQQDLDVHSVKKTFIWMGNRHVAVEDVPSGNTVAMADLDLIITKSVTLTNETEVNAHPIRAMKFSVSPVVRIAVSCADSDLREFLKGLKRLSRSDPMVVCTIEEKRQHIIAGAGGFSLKSKSCETVNSKFSYNRRNRIHNLLKMEASPMNEQHVNDIDKWLLDGSRDEEFAWDDNGLGKKILYFPGPNMVVNIGKGDRYPDSIKESIVVGFQFASKKYGVLARENMRGIFFKVCDVILKNRDHVTDILDASTNAIYASQLTAKPRLLETVYLVEIQSRESYLAEIHRELNNRHGNVFKEMPREGTPLYKIKAWLPVVESFGFSGYLQGPTNDDVFPQCESLGDDAV
uniref:Elongation factor 2 n=1 Tax=Tanacetum cinerariifolium TaxID=118510 RepID=A0A699IV38_TANCI|nr:elongation factor 2 [Tanacetum cinerariifolium]